METIMVVLVSAIIATLVMTSMLYALVWDGFEHGDTIRALGKEATTQPRRFMSVGMAMYLAVGLALSWVYYLALRLFQFDSLVVSIGFSGAIGFTQGFLVMHFYIAEVGLHHPFAQFNKHWLPLPFAHWFSHMVFGASLGSMIAAYMLHGRLGFWMGTLLNMGAAGLISAFARKAQLVQALRGRRKAQ